MKTKYRGHEITVLKSGYAVIYGHAFANIADAIEELNWRFAMGDKEVTMQTRVVDL